MPSAAAFDSECALAWGDGIGGSSLLGAAEAGSAITANAMHRTLEPRGGGVEPAVYAIAETEAAAGGRSASNQVERLRLSLLCLQCLLLVSDWTIAWNAESSGRLQDMRRTLVRALWNMDMGHLQRSEHGTGTPRLC